MFKKWRKWREKSNFTQVGLDNAAGGTLNTSSPTWNFMLKWCDDELENARKANDNIHLGAIKTTTLRARIQLLKEIKDIPTANAPIDYKGLFAADFEDFETFPGY